MASPPSNSTQSTSRNLEELARKLRAPDRTNPYTFVDPFPEEVQYECPICLEILQSPQIISCCGNKFCLKCTKSLKPLKCPLCNTREVQFFPEKQLERQINQRRIYCLLKNDGCDWNGELCKMNDHFDGLNDTVACQYFPVPCENCSEYVRRGSMESHIKVCNQLLKCEFCDCRVKTEQQLRVHYKTCTASPIVCPNAQCLKAVKKSEDLKAHKEECPWSLLTCEYHDAGCYGQILRKDMESHMAENMQTHLNLVKEKLSRLQQELESRGEVSFLVVSDLPEDALEEHKVKSRFGQFGLIDRVEVLDEDLRAAIVVFSEPNTAYKYKTAMDESRKGNIRLCRENVQVNPVYTKN